MSQFSLLVVLVPAFLYGAEDCIAPPAALNGLKAYLSYKNPLGGVMKFSLARVGADTLFRRYGVPPGYDPAWAFVYVYREGQPVLESGCRADSAWTQCAEESLSSITIARTPPGTEGGPGIRVEQSCDLSITIPVWRPSPDGPSKRKLAADLLKEATDGWDSSIRAVYVRDFNIGDPDLLFDVVDSEGRDNFQGCHFDPSSQPHCGWHMFGQTPVGSLKDFLMERPYKLFPPGTPPPAQ